MITISIKCSKLKQYKNANIANFVYLDVCPPPKPIFIFMSVFGIFWPDNRLAPPFDLVPPWEILDPLLITGKFEYKVPRNWNLAMRGFYSSEKSYLQCCCKIFWCQHCHFWQLFIKCEKKTRLADPRGSANDVRPSTLWEILDAPLDCWNFVVILAITRDVFGLELQWLTSAIFHSIPFQKRTFQLHNTSYKLFPTQ